jgi:putative endonuclease
VGVTNDLARRVSEHRSKAFGGFTARYNVDRLVYMEQTPSIEGAILREKQIKGWRREKKDALIASLNPDWADLTADW